MMSELKEICDVCVVGAGHAGCEAALACARLGFETVIFTVVWTALPLCPAIRMWGGLPRDTW